MASNSASAPTHLPGEARSKRRYIPRLWLWLILGLVIFVAIGITLPVFNSTCVKGPETMALAHAKQIGLALELFASDNGGNYPRAGVPATMTAAPANANEAFAYLLPTYTTNETIFANKLSPYQTRTPDNVLDSPDHPHATLEPGENAYGYIMGLTDKSPSDAPLIVDGTDGTGYYNSDKSRRGGVWEGKSAIVIRANDTGGIEKLSGPPDKRFIPRTDARSQNLLDASYLKSQYGPEVRLLDPAVSR